MSSPQRCCRGLDHASAVRTRGDVARCRRWRSRVVRRAHAWYAPPAWRPGPPQDGGAPPAKPIAIVCPIPGPVERRSIRPPSRSPPCPPAVPRLPSSAYRPSVDCYSDTCPPTLASRSRRPEEDLPHRDVGSDRSDRHESCSHRRRGLSHDHDVGRRLLRHVRPGLCTPPYADVPSDARRGAGVPERAVQLLGLSPVDDVARVLTDRDTSARPRAASTTSLQLGIELPSGLFIFEDPPWHTIHRQSRVPALHSPGDRTDRRPCTALFEGAGGGPGRVVDQFDFVKDFANMLPSRSSACCWPARGHLGPFATPSTTPRTKATAEEVLTPGGIAEAAVWFSQYLDYRRRESHRRPDEPTALPGIRGRPGYAAPDERDELLNFLILITGAGSDTDGELPSAGPANCLVTILTNDGSSWRTGPHPERGGRDPALRVDLVPHLPDDDEGGRVPRRGAGGAAV